ncbi:hypothetical protein MKX03_003852 [Papaver bracteatum]|nr:hypothetical protein MKX03_003852 [Papaver bracteatum]
MGEENKVKDEALQILGLFETLPRLVVFDLDYTIWPLYWFFFMLITCEMPKLYPHVNGIISAIKEKGIDMAIASRSPTPDIAKTFLGKLKIQSMFVAHKELQHSLTKLFDVDICVCYQRVHDIHRVTRLLTLLMPYSSICESQIILDDHLRGFLHENCSAGIILIQRA